MKAVIVRKPGGVEELQLSEVPEPALRPNCVRIAVKAAALNRADLLQRRGLYPPPTGTTEVLGLECAGEIVEIGAEVNANSRRQLAVGDRTMALLAGGGYAEQVVVPASHTLKIPKALSFTEAAAIPEAFLTAQEALFSLGQLAAGQTVLIHAAGGGVGSAAVQLAHSRGAHVVATAGSAAKRSLASKLGARRVVDYRSEDFATACLSATEGAGVSMILDFVGAAHSKRHQMCLAKGGRWVVVGVLGGARVEVNFAKLLSNRWQLLGLVMRSRSETEKAQLIEEFTNSWLPLFDSAQLAPVIDQTFALEDVAKAHQRMEANENLGKIILTL